MYRIALGVALGFLLGIVPKANLLAALIVLLLFLLPANILIGLTVAGVVSLLTPWIAPFADELGGFVLTSNIGQQLGGLAFQLPLVPWTMLDNTLVLGSFLIGLVLFVPVFLTAWVPLRAFVSRKDENTPQPLPEGEATSRRNPKPKFRIPRFLRLMILALLIVIACVFRDEIIRFQVVAQIQSQSGAAAELDSVQTHLPNGSIELSDLRLLDPKDRSKELLSIEKITAQAASKDWLQRYFHCPIIELQGVRVVVDGTEGTELVPDKLWTKLKQNLPDFLSPGDGLDWTAFLADDTESVAKNLLNQFDSIKFAHQLHERWPKEVERIRQLAESLKARFANVRNLANQTKQPGDKLELVSGILKELDGADQGTRQLIEAIEELQTKARTDYDVLVAASRKDQTQLQSLKAPSVNTANITESLIGNEIREQWNQTVTWGDWARSLLVPVELGNDQLPIYERFGLAPPKKVRGETIRFATLDARPELLFDTVQMTGQVLFGDLPIFFNGTIKHIVTPLELGPEPMISQFCFSGSGVPDSAIRPEQDANVPVPAALNPNLPTNLYVTLIVDRLGGNEEDQLILSCPLYELPSRILGDPKNVALSVSPGRSQLDGVILFKGERLDGQIRIKQESVRLTAILPDKLQQSPLHRVLQETLVGLNGFVAEISVSGTRSEPQYVFKSDIADKLRPQIENLVLQEWEGILRKADVAVADEVNKAVTVLNDAIQKHLAPLVQEANGQKTLLEQQITQATGTPLDQLLQAQIAQLSPQDQQKLERFTNTPLIQSLLKSDGTPNQVDQLLQKGTEKLQQKLPGALDKLLNR